MPDGAATIGMVGCSRVATVPALHLDGDLRVPASAFRLAGFRAWVTSAEFPEHGRATFVDGEVILQMSPDSIESHAKVKAAITMGFARIVEEEELGELYPDGVLLTNAAAGVSTEPDACFATFATLASGKLRLVPRVSRADEYVEVQGAPDIVVEIVSDSSEEKDLRRLRAAYARSGIPEYWLIDARGERLRFEILRLVRGAYRAASTRARSQHSRVLGRAFRLERKRNPAGRWTYRLVTVAGRSPRRR